MSDQAGAIDLTLDANPRILYAAFWEAVRKPYQLISGGPGSGIWRSTDGGETWEELTHKPGLPAGTLGKIGIAASPAQSGRVYAIVEAKDGAVFRSDDYGETWLRCSEDPKLRERPWYFNHITADPQDADCVYIESFLFHRSDDGGKTFQILPTTHADHHDLWIDPNDNKRMIIGHDGGANVSFNRAVTWSTVMNQPTMEFYHVTTDTRQPYRIYGAQQDNTTICTPSRSAFAAIGPSENYVVGGGESGYIAVRPDNPDIVFAGSYGGVISRYDHRTGYQRSINIWPELSPGHAASEVKYRFQWTYPIVLSPHDPNVLYATSQHVHRSTNEGQSWEVISPDLTRNDKSKQEASAGPITFDNTGAEYYDTIFAFAESPVTQGVLWTGADDGLIHVSRDNGQSWTNVTPPASLLPEWALISIIEASPHAAGTAYVAATRYKSDDFKPYLLKTNDYGEHWSLIVSGIPDDVFTRAIREDPNRQGLLYAGTETGLYISFDDGANWTRFEASSSAGPGQVLPVVPIHDLVIKDHDLIVATHGRGFWVLDDIAAIEEASSEIAEKQSHLFRPQPATRWITHHGFGSAGGPGTNYTAIGSTHGSYHVVTDPDGTTRQQFLDAGNNPPDGVYVDYYLESEPEGAVKLTFLDDDGHEIRSYSSELGESANGDKKATLVLAKAGINRFVWDMRYPDAVNVPGAMFRGGGVQGPIAPPGSYQVRLEANGETQTQRFEIRRDPRLDTTDEALQEQFKLQLQIRDKLSETHEAVNRLRSARQQVDGWKARAEAAGKEAVVAEAERMNEAMLKVERELIEARLRASKDPLRFPPRLNAKLVALSGMIANEGSAPTQQSYEVFEELAKRVDQQLEQLPGLLESDVARFNRLIEEAGLPPVGE
ncbi:MAG TPA: glycosyl hydrolase [Thermomicrobiaceae bacterium]|nr:glycosyl hydrolase [Thermomicrobiaceae bacterium]